MIIIMNNNNNNNDLEVAHPQSGYSSTPFLIELEFGNVGFWGEGKTGVPGENPLGAKERTNNKLNPHMASTPGFEPGPHWWEASALTTAPSLAPVDSAIHVLNNWGLVSWQEGGSGLLLFEKGEIWSVSFRGVNWRFWYPLRGLASLLEATL